MPINELKSQDISFLSEFIDEILNAAKSFIEDLTIYELDLRTGWKNMRVNFRFRSESEHSIQHTIDSESLKRLYSTITAIKDVLDKHSMIISDVVLNDWGRGLVEVSVEFETPIEK